MDPSDNLKEQITLAREIQRLEAEARDSAEDLLYAGSSLAELVLALHEWRSRGGFDPYVEGYL